MSDIKNLQIAVEKAYESRRESIIIGLTGVTGVGCSTVASILSRKEFKDLDLRDIKSWDCRDSEERKEYVINEYIKYGHNWQPFYVVEVSGIILTAVFEKNPKDFVDYLRKLSDCKKDVYLKIADEKRLYKVIQGLTHWYEQYQKCDSLECSVNGINSLNWDKVSELKKQVREQLQQFKCYEIKRGIDESEDVKPFNFYTYIMQRLGKNLRMSGDPFEDNFKQECVFNFAERINSVVQLIQKNDKLARICIDAIRNPYEATYFRDHYKHFYLFAVSADRRIERLDNLENDEVRSQDEVENAEKLSSFEEEFYRQDIRKCTEIADVHIHNFTIDNGKYYDLTKQLIKYVALILHPGLVTPTAVERCMQLAYVAKLNSGCLSRQVGAIVTRSDYSVQSEGWNDVPHGQVPCNLRNIFSFCDNKDSETYSQFELQNHDFYDAIGRLVKKSASVSGNDNEKVSTFGRCFTFCFKDVYNGMKKEKNQVFTRSLHAEENAFLQVTKYGGTGVKGGFLFTTASPCELCAKKAYQLGISRIYYIDPYPGISMQHILCFGKNDNPEIINFYGAIGEAYVDLYRPRMPFKDELEMLTGISVKKDVKVDAVNESWEFDEITIVLDRFTIEFISSEDVELHRLVKVKLKKGFEERGYVHDINWTGVVPCDVKVEKNENCDVKILKRENPYSLLISGKQGVCDSDDLSIEYDVKFCAKDTDGVMETNIGHRVRYMTEEVELKIVAPKNAEYVKNVKLIEYADFEMKKRVNEWEVDSCSIIRQNTDEKENIVYTANIGKSSDTDTSLVSVGHVYVLEWNKMEREP